MKENDNNSLNNNIVDLNSDSSCSKIHHFIKNNKNMPKEIYNFSPKINKKFNRGMFSQSPLSNDELLNKRIKDLRENNFKNFINNYEKNNREILSNYIKKNKDLLKELINCENKNMRMDIEKKTNKDTFENFHNFDLYDDNYYYNNQINEPLFTVEIKIKQTIKTIEVYQDDSPEKLAYDFLY